MPLSQYEVHTIEIIDIKKTYRDITELQLVLAMAHNLSSATVRKIDPKGEKESAKMCIQKHVKKG